VVESLDLWQAFINTLTSFGGAFAGSMVAFRYLGGYYGKQMAKGYRSSMNEYLKKEEEALNEKFQRRKV
jgi:uncharacterized membrane protein YdjX (TVP38/TMEM64 family)